MTEVLLMIGTRKGAFTLRSSQGRQKWELAGPVMGGQDVNWMTFDRQTGRMYALFNDAWFGPQVQYSTDLGKTWASCATSPRFKNDPKEVSDQAPWVFQENKVLERLWALEPGGRPGELYCAVAPATMFKSSDGGDSWEELESLTNHRTRERWEPGAGGLMVHSMVVDPDNPDRITIAISAAGVFQTDDGGKTWEPRNVNIRDVAAQMDPNVEKYPEAGQCVHHLVPTPRKGRMYLQGHWGTYRTDDDAASWVDITEGLPSEFGLAMAAHPGDADMAYTWPLIGGEMRTPPGGAMKVWRTADAGKTWQGMTKGLPQEEAWMGVYRQGLCTDALDPAGVYFGTNTGHLYASRDDGDSWTLVRHLLPPILSVSAATLD